MRAVVAHEAGGPEMLRLEEVPDPQPSEGEVLVRVETEAHRAIEARETFGKVILRP